MGGMEWPAICQPQQPRARRHHRVGRTYGFCRQLHTATVRSKPQSWNQRRQHRRSRTRTHRQDGEVEIVGKPVSTVGVAMMGVGATLMYAGIKGYSLMAVIQNLVSRH